MLTDQVRRYRPAGIFYVVPAIAGGIFGIIGIGLLADFSETGWSGIVAGILVIATTAYMLASMVTISVTIHEQGVVIRKNLRRRFIPWQAVKEISSGPNVGFFPRYTVRILVDTGVTYMEKMDRLDGASGSKARTLAIVAEMQEFQRRERAARDSRLGGSLAAGRYVP